jgi:hypothetical protein
VLHDTNARGGLNDSDARNGLPNVMSWWPWYCDVRDVCAILEDLDDYGTTEYLQDGLEDQYLFDVHVVF